MNDPFVTIDLHGLMRDEAMRRIDRTLRDAGSGVYQVRLIHGYHSGTALRDMVRDTYRSHPKILRLEMGLNPGETDLVLREF